MGTGSFGESFTGTNSWNTTTTTWASSAADDSGALSTFSLQKRLKGGENKLIVAKNLVRRAYEIVGDMNGAYFDAVQENTMASTLNEIKPYSKKFLEAMPRCIVDVDESFKDEEWEINGVNSKDVKAMKTLEQ